MRAMIRQLHLKLVTLEFDDLDWSNKHVRYFAVAGFSGALNVMVYTCLNLFRPETVGIKWYAVVTGGAVGWIGHKVVSYGYGEKFKKRMIFKFIGGMLMGAIVYKGASSVLEFLANSLLNLLPWDWSVPYICIHVASMGIGFICFQQWNLWVTFRKTKSPDGPVVIHVELSDE